MFFCSCSYWIKLWSIKFWFTLLEATVVVVVSWGTLSACPGQVHCFMLGSMHLICWLLLQTFHSALLLLYFLWQDLLWLFGRNDDFCQLSVLLLILFFGMVTESPYFITLVFYTFATFPLNLTFTSSFSKRDWFALREGVKNTQRGGALKFAAEVRKTLTPPKNS